MKYGERICSDEATVDNVDPLMSQTKAMAGRVARGIHRVTRPPAPRVRLVRRMLHWWLREVGVVPDQHGIWWNDRKGSTHLVSLMAMLRVVRSPGNSTRFHP